MASLEDNYEYGVSPLYKDDGVTGLIFIKKIDPDTGEKTLIDFPVIDISDSEYQLGYTGLNFVPNKIFWDLGDGSKSSNSTPVYTYNTYGYHKVALTVMNNLGETAVINNVEDHYIIIGKMDFSGDPLSGDKPLTVSFEDDSVAPTGYQYTGMQWDFGDSRGATGQNPTHNYQDYGSYTVGINATLDNI